MLTPWGRADSIEEMGPEGIKMVSTPSHGGIFVPKTLLNQMPKKYRACCTLETAKGGWFEEDCDAMAVIRAFPKWFDRYVDEGAEEDDEEDE